MKYIHNKYFSKIIFDIFFTFIFKFFYLLYLIKKIYRDLKHF